MTHLLSIQTLLSVSCCLVVFILAYEFLHQLIPCDLVGRVGKTDKNPITCKILGFSITYKCLDIALRHVGPGLSLDWYCLLLCLEKACYLSGNEFELRVDIGLKCWYPSSSLRLFLFHCEMSQMESKTQQLAPRCPTSCLSRMVFFTPLNRKLYTNLSKIHAQAKFAC